MTEPLELAGRRALVTGAGSGIGLATAQLLHQRGAQVAAVVQDQAQADHLQQQLPEALVLVQDLLDSAACAALPALAAQGLGGLDALACCAGIFVKKGSDDTTLEEWRQTLDLNLTATFVVQSVNYLTIETVGQQDFTFRSYIGEGDAGHFASLNSQMNGRFGNRHDKFQLTPPNGADYLLVKYPPTPVDPYMGFPEINADQPASGSYRLVGSGNTLSVDHVNSMALPLAGQWQDADQSGGNYLKFFSNAGRIAVPEYFVPAGIAYHPCMRNGGCAGDLLDRIYNATMTMSVYYYRVGRIADGLNRVPLRLVGPSWKPGAVAATVDVAALGADQENATASAETRKRNEQVYLPYVSVAVPPPAIRDDGDRNGCPCGWFDSLGRMLDYVPGP